VKAEVDMGELVEAIVANELKQDPESAEQASEPMFRPPELVKIAEEAKGADVPPRVSVRTLLSWFGAQRRGSFIVWLIRSRLEELGVETKPDFNAVWIDAEVSFVPTVAAASETGAGGGEAASHSKFGLDTSGMLVMALDPPVAFVGGAIEDPTYRIGKLDAANKPVVSIAPNQTLEQAVTMMLVSGFSQLPVMQGERDVKGVLTWESIGARLALGKTCGEARDCMTPPQIINSERSLFEAIKVIEQFQYVLVKAPDNRISGIVTAFDLSQQFQQLTEPFLLLGEIEQHVRKLIVDKFTREELKGACDPGDLEREIQNVADLTMGEYVRLLENPTNWEKLHLQIDRATFVDKLKAIKRVRNDIMHFDPDPLGAADLLLLRQFVVFMQSLREFGAF
jgi:CBS domain-containing protein